ncbi:hypothetical protein pb186bvf_013072 [Paramecium bursaria]
MNIQILCEEHNLKEQYEKSMDDGEIQRLQQQLQRHQEFQQNLQTFLNRNPFQMVNDSIIKFESEQIDLANTLKERDLLEQNIQDLDQQIQTNQQEISILEEQIHSLREYLEAQLNMIMPNIHQIRMIGDQILNDREMYVSNIDIRNGYSYNIVGAINIILPLNRYFRKTGDQRLRTYTCNHYELNSLIRSLQEINLDEINERFREQFNNINTQQQSRSIILDGLYNILRLINQNYDQYRSLRPLKQRLQQMVQQIRMKMEIIYVQRQKESSLKQNKVNLDEICENQKQYLDQNENIYNNQKELIMIINQCIKLNKAAEQNIIIFKKLYEYQIIRKIIELINRVQDNIQINVLNQLLELIREQMQEHTIFDLTSNQQIIILDQYNLRNIWVHYNELFRGDQFNQCKFISDSNQQYQSILAPTKLIIQRLLYVFLNNNLAFELQIRNQDYVMKMIEKYLNSEEFIYESTSLIMFQSYLNFYYEDNIDEDLVNLFILILNNIPMADCDIIGLFKAYAEFVQQYPNKIELYQHILDDFKYFQNNQSKQQIRSQLLQSNFNDTEKFISVILRELQQQQFIGQFDIDLLQDLMVKYGIPEQIISNYQTISQRLTNYIQQLQQDFVIFQKFTSKANNINYLFEMEQFQIKHHQLQLRKVDMIKQQILEIQAQIKEYELTIEELVSQKEGLNYQEISYQPFQLQKIQLSQIFLVERPNRHEHQVIEIFLNILGFGGSWEECKKIIKINLKQKIQVTQISIEYNKYSNNNHLVVNNILSMEKLYPGCSVKFNYFIQTLKIKTNRNNQTYSRYQQLNNKNKLILGIKNLDQLQKQLNDQSYIN